MNGAGLFTAETCARAVIAAAGFYQVDPLVAATAPHGSHKRAALVAAAAAINIVLDVSMPTVVRVFELGKNAVYAARGRPRAQWAEDVAAEALKALGPSTPPDPPLAPAPPPRPSAPVYRPPPVPAAPVHRAAPGRITSQYAPTMGVPSRLPAAERALGDRILDVLQDGSASAVGMASLLGTKEALVGQSLSMLAHAGLIEGGELPAAGARHRRWALVRQAAA